MFLKGYKIILVLFVCVLLVFITFEQLTFVILNCELFTCFCETAN
jgi:hypothetical protein